MSKTLRHDVEQEVRRVVSEIKSICPNSRIYLFGSAVDSNAVNIRDIDFLIEIPDELDFKTTRKRILCEVMRTIWALDIIVVPNSFLKSKLEQGGNFYAFAVQEGILINEAA